MRRTRMKNRTMSGLVTFLILAIVFVGSGYLIGKFLLASLLQRTPKGQPVTGDQTQQPAGTTSITVQISTKPLTLYRVQLGAFSTRERAENTAQLAIEQGVAAGVMSPDPLHKVYCGVTSSKEAAKKLAETALPKLGGIVAEGDNLYVATMEVDACNLSLTGSETTVQQLEKAFSTLDNAITSLIGFWDQYYLGQQISIDLASMETDITAVKTGLAQVSPDSGTQTAHEVALKVATDLEGAINTARRAQGGDGGSAIEGMTKVIKIIDEYVQNLKKLE